jgi:hypothetical protein
MWWALVEALLPLATDAGRTVAAWIARVCCARLVAWWRCRSSGGPLNRPETRQIGFAEAHIQDLLDRLDALQHFEEI